MLPVAVALLTLAIDYPWLDVHLRREGAAGIAPRPVYRCRRCGRPVDMGATFRPIRLSLLCPDDCRGEFGALPPPGPRRWREAARPATALAHPLVRAVLGGRGKQR